MAEICGTCKAKARYEYWHKLPVTKQKFFKLMLRDFKHQMTIPREFVKNFNGYLSSWCTLKGPSGNEWEVRVRRGEEDVLFSRGWDIFVRDHGIEECDFLVFHYVGNSSFQVFVFDASGCEREGFYFTKVNLSGSSCRSNFPLEDNDNAMNQGEEFAFSFGESDMNDGENSATPLRGNHRRRAQNSHYNALYKGRLKLNPRCNTFEDGDDNYMEVEEEDDEETEQSFSYGPRVFKPVKQAQKCYISSRREVTDREKKRAYTKANDYLKRRKSSGVPMVGIVMLRTHVYKGLYLTIPKEWAMEHMVGKDHELELHVSGKNEYWLVGCRWSPAGQCQLRPRWAEFVLDNNLEEGDACVFELIQKGSNTGKTHIFSVQIFRVVSEVVPLTAKRMV